MNKNIASQNVSEQLQDAHKWFTETIKGVTTEVAAFQPPGTANPIAGTYAHLVMSEDFFINSMIQGKAPLFETDWKDKTGASEIQPTEWESAYPKWLREVQVDIDQMNKYAAAVFKNSEEYVKSLSDEDLLKEVDMSAFGMGNRTLGSVIGGMIIGHVNQIMGEIAVLKGIQGLKGYPF